MKATINISEELFRYLFKHYNRENNFTHEGLGILYQHLSDLEEEGKPQELNVVDLCMKYSEEAIKDFCFHREIPTFYCEPVDVDENKETIYVHHALSRDQLTDNILDYFREGEQTLIGLTDTIVLFY